MPLTCSCRKRKTMNRYRAIVQVPTIVEFDNPGTMKHVTDQIEKIAAGMPSVNSAHPRQMGVPYVSKVLECVRLEQKEPIILRLDDLTAPGTA